MIGLIILIIGQIKIKCINELYSIFEYFFKVIIMKIIISNWLIIFKINYIYNYFTNYPVNNLKSKNIFKKK